MLCRAQEQPRLRQQRRNRISSSSASTSFLQFAFPTLIPPKIHIFPHPSSSLLEKKSGSAWTWQGWRTWLLFASQIQPFWSSPGSDPHTEPLPATGSLALTPPSSSAATKDCDKRLSSGWQHRIPGKDGNSFPHLSQQWLNDVVCPCPPPRSAIAITLRL